MSKHRRNLRRELDAVCNVIRGQFGKQPGQKLAFAILERAIYDMHGFFGLALSAEDQDYERANAIRWIKGEMAIVDKAGVEPDWVRHKLNQHNLLAGA